MFHVSSKIFHLFVFFSALKIVSWFFIVFESSLPTLIDIISFILIVLMVFFFAIEIQSFPLSPHSVRIVSLSLIMEVVINVPLPFFEKKNATCFSALSTEEERKMDDFIWKKRILPWERWMVQIHHHFWKQMCCWLSVCSEFHKYLVTSLSSYTFFSKFLMFFTKSFASTRDIIQSLSDLFWIYVGGWLGI